MIGTPIYQSWCSMKNRCCNPNASAYRYYGGRGIVVCERWLDFSNFYADMREGWFEGASIDRVDNNQGYEPGNCRWANAAQQSQNRTHLRTFEYHGMRLTIPQIASMSGLKTRTVYYRLVRYGWNVARCIHTPARKVS